MIAATAKFKGALTHSHESLSRVTVDDVVMPIEGGAIVADQTRNVRRTGSVSVVRSSDTETTFYAITTASRVKIEKGIRFLDRTEEYVTIATMVVQEINMGMRKESAVLALSDEGQFVDDYPLVYAWAPVDGGGAQLTYINAIKALIEDALTSVVTWNVSGSVPTTITPEGTLIAAGTNRWQAINDLSTAIGAEVYPNPMGVWVIRPVPTAPLSSLEVASGPSGVLIDAQGKASRRNTFNGVAIEWGTTEVQGGVELVVDSDSTSPTYWDGVWGRKPKPTVKLAVTSQVEAITAGAAELALSKGAQSGLSLSAVYNPLLEPGDAVNVTKPGELFELHILDGISLSLTAGTMTAATRVVSAT